MKIFALNSISTAQNNKTNCRKSVSQVSQPLKCDTLQLSFKGNPERAILSILDEARELVVDDSSALLTKFKKTAKQIGPESIGIKTFVGMMNMQDENLALKFLTSLPEVNGKVNVNVVDDFKNTPLHYAFSRGKLLLAQQLDEMGANPNVANRDEKLPAYYLR